MQIKGYKYIIFGTHQLFDGQMMYMVCIEKSQKRHLKW
jgi:hypothetical protein